MAGLCATAQYTTHRWWLGLLAALFYMAQGFYEGWQEAQQDIVAKRWTPLSSQEARWQLRQERWKL